MQENKMSLLAAVILNINIMLGAGIFIMPGEMAKKCFDSSFLGWILIGLVLLPVVWSISQITKYFSGVTSFYGYSEKGINKSAGFLSGWLYFLGYASVPSVQLICLKEILVSQFKLGFLENNSFLFYTSILIFFCLINILSVKFISKIQNSVTFFKLVPLFFVIFVFVFYLNPDLVIRLEDLANLKYTIPMTLFAFWGFEASCNISHLIENSEKNASRAILLGFFSVVVIYTLFHLGVTFIMGSQNLIQYNASGYAAFLNIKYELILNLINIIISATILTAILSSTFGILFANSANLYSLASNKFLPCSDIICKLNRFSRPFLAVFATGAISLIFLFILNNKIVINSMINFGVLGTFVLTLLSLLLTQIKRKEYIKMIPTLLAFCSSFLIAQYSWELSGQDNLARILNLLPFICLVLVGFATYKFKECKTKQIN